MAVTGFFRSSVILNYILYSFCLLVHVNTLKDFTKNQESVGDIFGCFRTNSQRNFSQFGLIVSTPRGASVRHIGILQLSTSAKYLAARTRRYPNSSSTFQLTRLLVSGDSSPNPGPDKCDVCSRKIASNQPIPPKL